MSAKFWEKAAHSIDWVIRGQFVIAVLGGLGLGKLVQWIISKFAQVSPTLATAIWLLTSALIVWLMMLFKLRQHPQQPSGANPPSAPPPAQLSQTLNVDDFYKTFDNVLLTETETNVRALSDKYQSGADRERFFIRFLSSGIMFFVFETIWLNIYGSQIRLLEAANGRAISLDDARIFYANAVNAALENNPNPYKNYSFDAWLNFLQTWILITQHGTNIATTVRGREFLKYLVHVGRSVNNRRF